MAAIWYMEKYGFRVRLSFAIGLNSFIQAVYLCVSTTHNSVCITAKQIPETGTVACVAINYNAAALKRTANSNFSGIKTKTVTG